MTDWHAIGRAIQKRRNELGLTQDEAAARSDNRVSRATWTNLETGKSPSVPRRRTLDGIGDVLQWPEDWFEQLDRAGTVVAIQTPDVLLAIAQDPALDERAKQLLTGAYLGLVGRPPEP